MRIVLIHPPPLEKEDIFSNIKYPPLGITSIAAVLRNSGHDVFIYDGHAMKANANKVADFVDGINPDLVGITATTSIIHHGFEVAKKIKERNTEMKIVMGGVHPTVAPNHTMENKDIDFAVIGEGEYTTLELINSLRNGNKALKDIKGLVFRENGKIIINERRPLIENLDELPIPAYDLLPISKYDNVFVSRKPFMTMITSRGCPYRCIFCGVASIFGHKYRHMSPERAVKEVEHLVNELDIKEILFKDSEFTLDAKNVEAFCELLKSKKLDLEWSCNGRVSNVTKSTLTKMKEAGCRSITYGIESGDQKTLNILKKDITIEQIKKAIKITKEVGLEVVGDFMIGCPGETKETIKKTVDLAIELDLDYGSFSFVSPFPGTELREMAEKNGWLLDASYQAVRYERPSMNATKLTNKELAKALNEVYRTYYLRPSFILKRLRKMKIKDIKSTISGAKSIATNTIMVATEKFFKKNKDDER